jgi:hypothetical protein
MTKLVSEHCTSLPTDLAGHLDAEFAKIQKHYLLREWDDLQVDGGRLCEAILRVIEWKMNGTFTPIDGKSRPNRKTVVNAATHDTNLPPSLRLQVINALELVMDFRNSRNAAHLGNIDPNQIDAMTVYQLIIWMIGEIIRLESTLKPVDIQEVLTVFAERPVPLIYRVNNQPIILSTKLSAPDTVLVLLYDSIDPVDFSTLFKWSRHTNITKWRDGVIKALEKSKKIYIENKKIHLLPPGMTAAEQLITEYRAN